jgi:hypothetical protein
MTRLIVIVVYSRIENIRTWARCWKDCDQTARIVVIHNIDTAADVQPMKSLCEESGFCYVSRANRGFDIGAFQDVIHDRLPVPGFPEWDELLWVCDDTVPMQKDFAARFFDQLTPGIGVVCMEISPYVRKHIRTTGFAIRKEVAKRLKFPADPVLTKQDCYHFEHRGGKETFCDQIEAMGLTVIMAAPREKSPMWDTGYHRKLPRQAEFEKVFPAPQKVLFICPAFEKFPVIIASLLAQTHEDWELWLIHDGPMSEDMQLAIGHFAFEDRITVIEAPHSGNWGHVHRKDYLDKAAYETQFDYVVITNADNYHVPTYCEYMLSGFNGSPGTIATYCSEMVHSYKAWQVIACRMERGYIDCAGVMIRRSAACEVGWNDTTGHSADWTYFSDVMKKFGKQSFKPVRGCLLIHN